MLIAALEIKSGLPWMTCFDNVHLAVERVFGATESKAQLKQRTHDALKLVGLSHAGHLRPGEAAGGLIRLRGTD